MSPSSRSSPPMSFEELQASPDLDPWVDCYWHFQVSPDAGELEHWVPPDGGLSLAYNVATGHLGLSGPFLEPFRPPVYPDMEVWGVRFWPGAGQALLGVEPGAARGRFLEAGSLLGTSTAAALTGALGRPVGPGEAAEAFNRWLVPFRSRARPLDPRVQTAVSLLIRSRGQEPVSTVARVAGLSSRQLRRLFGRQVGLSPKELARIRRFRASAIEAVEGGEKGRPSSWVKLAVDHGYADQAHLVHEYRRLIGLPPRAFAVQFAKIRHRLLEE